MSEFVKYNKGQKIICLESESWCWLPIIPGEVYTIRKKYKCPCGSEQLILEEIVSRVNMLCHCGRNEYRDQSFYEWRFRPYEAS